jgi:hypothetical protein
MKVATVQARLVAALVVHTLGSNNSPEHLFFISSVIVIQNGESMQQCG